MLSLARCVTVLTMWLLGHPGVVVVVHSIRRCGRDICRDDQVCCAQGNDTTAVTCCRQFVDNTYYNIAMVTRKLSGILIMLLLFAVGYFVQRILCTRSSQRSPAQGGQPAVTASQEMLMESCTPVTSVDPGSGARLPTYEDCKRLPTYEETMRGGNRGRSGCVAVGHDK